MTDDAGQDTPVMSLTVNGADLFVAGGPDDDTADDLTDTFDHLLDRYLDMRDAEAENGFGVQ